MTAGLIARIETAADRGGAVVFAASDETERVPWSRLLADARNMAAAMQARGVGPGDRVAVLGTTSRTLLTAIEATWLAGAALIVLPLPVRVGSEEEFRASTRTRISLGEVSLLIADPDLLAVVAPDPDLLAVTFGVLQNESARMGEAAYERPHDDRDATAILQFTSGSTSDPKGVVIPQRCLTDNVDALAERAPLDADDDVMVSWLPQYHDMGLVANTSYAMLYGAEYVLAPPQRFVASPGAWLEWISTFGGTWSLAPNFGFSVAARLLERSATLDLSSCRTIGSGSEPVDAAVMDAFAVAGARHGLNADALCAAYGMAEATVCISFPYRGSGFTTDIVDGSVLEHERRAVSVATDDPAARRMARCGPPVRGMELRIVDPETGTAVADRVLGEIEIRGPSVVPGYFRRPDATAAAFRAGGWLRTGDLGYLVDGDVVVGGRLKDVIMVGGRNVFPDDIERATQTVSGVRAGNVIAFGVRGGRKGESVVVVAEVKTDDIDRVRSDISVAVRETVGLRLEDIVLLRPGSLPKTSSGKLRRSICRARYEASELEVV
ncbi:MAG TPA: AMP-binding protein [Acidimicrobiales bacterium]|nr:AMP-binding protein [Acidimicrobiales bacterium]